MQFTCIKFVKTKLQPNFNTFAAGSIQVVHAKTAGSNSWIARDFAWEFLRSGKRYRPDQKLKRQGKSCSSHSKIFFGWGCRFFV